MFPLPYRHWENKEWQCHVLRNCGVPFISLQLRFQILTFEIVNSRCSGYESLPARIGSCTNIGGFLQKKLYVRNVLSYSKQVPVSSKPQAIIKSKQTTAF